MVGGYGAIVMQKSGLSASLPEMSLQKILPKDLAMDNPRYEGFDEDGSSYTFTAKTARQDLTAPNIIKLETISGVIYGADKARTDVTAVRGVFDRKRSVLDLFKQIDVVSQSGLKATLTQATLFTKTSVITSKKPVVVEFPSGTVRSQQMTLKQKERQVSFVDKVETYLKPTEEEKAKADAAKADAAKSGPAKPTGFLAPSGEPINITSARLDIDDNRKVSLFTGDVVARQGEATLSTPELEVSYEGDAAPGTTAKTTPASATAPSGKVSRIVAKAPVVMTRGDTDRVTSDNADFDVINETAILSGNLIMTSGEDRRVTGDRADLDQRNDTALVTGATVVVLQGRNELSGRRLFVDRKNGHTQITSPPGGGRGPGRVTAHLVRSEEKPGAKANRKPAAAAAEADDGIAQFSTDPDAPIDVEADQLDVMENAKVATFRGSVQAVQGDFIVKSAELHAYYTGEAKLADVGAQKPAEAKSTATEITRIEAKKDVLVTSKDGQTAAGDWANFDAKKETVTVGGGDVVLTQGQNVVHGTRVVIDMRNGKTTIDTAPPKTVSQPGGGGWVTEAPAEPVVAESKGRASAIFFPQQIKDANAAKNSAKPGTSTGAGGWEAQTAPSLTEPGKN